MRTFAQGLANVSITATTSFNILRPTGEGSCYILVNHTRRSPRATTSRRLSNVTRIRVDSLHVRETTLGELIDSAIGPPNSSFLQFALDGLECMRENWVRGTGAEEPHLPVASADAASEAPVDGRGRGARHRAQRDST